jgi:hypothetical protein
MSGGSGDAPGQGRLATASKGSPGGAIQLQPAPPPHPTLYPEDGGEGATGAFWFLILRKRITAQVWRSPPRKASGKESGSFLKKRTKKLLQIQAEPLRKGRSQLQAFLPLALPAVAYLGSYKSA